MRRAGKSNCGPQGEVSREYAESGVPESVAAGEKLAEVLDRDIERVHEVLEKQSAGILQRVLGDPGTEDIARRSDKFRELSRI